jgi:hypothetical protein
MVPTEASVHYRDDYAIGAKVEYHIYANFVCGGFTASIDASGSAWAYDHGSLYVQASSAAQASAKGNAAVSAMSTSSAAASAEFDAIVAANYDLTIKTTCSSTPSVPAPHLLGMTTINDILVNNSRTVDIDYSVASGHNAQLFCAARNGGTITAGKNQTLSGSGTTQITVMAPSEVPGPNAEYGIADKHDRVDCVLTQDDGQFDQISSNQYTIVMPVPDAP